MSNQLTPLRNQIDAIDAEIIALLIKRQEAIKQVAQIKRQLHLPTVDQTREASLLTKLQNLANHRLPGEYIAALYQVILDHSKTLQTQLREQS